MTAHVMPSDDMWGVFYLEGQTRPETAPAPGEEIRLCRLWNAAPDLLTACLTVRRISSEMTNNGREATFGLRLYEAVERAIRTAGGPEYRR